MAQYCVQSLCQHARPKGNDADNMVIPCFEHKMESDTTNSSSRSNYILCSATGTFCFQILHVIKLLPAIQENKALEGKVGFLSRLSRKHARDAFVWRKRHCCLFKQRTVFRFVLKQQYS